MSDSIRTENSFRSDFDLIVFDNDDEVKSSTKSE